MTGRDENCIFCGIVSGDVPGTIVYEDEHVVGFRDIQPAAPTHVLIVPRAHVKSLHEVTSDHREALLAILFAIQEIAEGEGVAEDGYRVVTNVGQHGGQTVDHLHFHVLGGRKLGVLG